MKSVLISINLKWCELIASGQKTIEVRKTRPKLETPFKCYIYCTKSHTGWKESCCADIQEYLVGHSAGKIIGEFVCNQIEDIAVHRRSTKSTTHAIIDGEIFKELVCMTFREAEKYRGNSSMYGWHISDLKIYDKPRELNEFKPYHHVCKYDDLGIAIPECEKCTDCGLTRPPQSWCYVEEI